MVQVHILDVSARMAHDTAPTHSIARNSLLQLKNLLVTNYSWNLYSRDGHNVAHACQWCGSCKIPLLMFVF
jgi:hypothetical protein